MAGNRYTQVDYNAPVSSYVPMPLDYIYKVGQAKQAQQDAAELERLDLLGKQWQMLPSDLEKSKQIKQDITKTLEDFSGKDFSSSAVRSEWLRKKKELADRFSMTGDIGNIQGNYDAYKAYEKDILSKSKELGWSQDEIRQHLNNAKQSFSGTVNPDNTFNYFQGQGVANYVDPNEWASKALKDVAADTGIEKLKRYSSLNAVTDAFRSGELEHKDYDKILNSLAARAKGDSKLLASLEQEGLFRGKQGWSQFMKGVDDKGNVLLNQQTPFGNILSGVAYGAQYQKEKENYMKVMDPWKLHQLKKKEEEQELQKQLNWTIQGVPADPNNVGATDAGINTILGTTGLGDHWQFKDGKLTATNKQGNTKSIVNIDGKEYNVNNLPDGYQFKVSPLTRSKMGVEGVPQNLVVGPDGKQYQVANKPVTKDDTVEAYKAILPIARRLGVNSNKPEDIRSAVEEYYKTANNFQMNFTTFDEGTKAALSNIFGAKTKTDAKGNFIITDPGQLSFSTIKTLDGKPINVENLDMYKAQLLTGANIVGPAQSLGNRNYQPGDMYIQAIDPETGSPKTFIINTNNQTFNMANAPASILTQSIDSYVNSGEVAHSPQLDKLNSNMGNKNYKFTSVIPDKNGNMYASYVDVSKKDKNGKPIVEVGAMKIDANGQPTKIGLDEANLQITKDYVSPLLPTFNVKNFDRSTKAETFDDIDSVINQAISEQE